MSISAMMGKQVAELQHTLNLSLLQSQMSTQTAQATVMLQDMTNAQKATQAPHPYLGSSLDLKG